MKQCKVGSCKGKKNPLRNIDIFMRTCRFITVTVFLLSTWALQKRATVHKAVPHHAPLLSTACEHVWKPCRDIVFSMINPSRKHVTVNHSFTKAVQTVYFEILLKHVILTMSVPHLVCSPPLSFIRADGGRGAVDWPQIWTWPSLWADPLQSHTVTDAAGPWLFCFVCLREPGVDHYLSSIFPSDIY